MAGFAVKAEDFGSPCIKRFDYSGGTSIIYVGEAYPGSSESSAVWRIYKLTYDANSNVTQVDWASGNNSFDKKWSTRTTYSYS